MLEASLNLRKWRHLQNLTYPPWFLFLVVRSGHGLALGLRRTKDEKRLIFKTWHMPTWQQAGVEKEWNHFAYLCTY